MEGECTACANSQRQEWSDVPVPRATRLSITPEVKIEGVLGD